MSKTPSIVSTILTVVLLLLFGTASMFFLLVALNGFSDREGGPAILTSLSCTLFGIILSAVAAWTLPRWLIGKFNWNSAVAVIVSVLMGFFFGSGVSVAAIIIGVIVADQLWKAR